MKVDPNGTPLLLVAGPLGGAARAVGSILSRTFLGSVVGNLDFSPLMPGGQSSAPQTEKDVK